MELNVLCACGRTMRTLGVNGDPRFRCGCGASVTIRNFVPPPSTACPMIYENGHRCRSRKQPSDYACPQCTLNIASSALRTPALRTRLATTEAYGIMKDRRDALLEEREEQRAEFFTDIQRRKEARECDVVYYVLIRPGVIKIGTTRNLARRMTDLRLSVADVLAAEPGDERLEKMRHKEFAELRITRREDFREDGRLRSHIDMLNAQFGSPGQVVKDLLTRKAAELA